MPKQNELSFSRDSLIARGATDTSARSTRAASKRRTTSSTQKSRLKAPALAAQPYFAKTKMAALVQPVVASKMVYAGMAVDPSFLVNVLDKTATQLAHGAIQQLKRTKSSVMEEAVNTVKNRKIRPDKLMNFLERRVKIGEVLNEIARRWDGETKTDFAQALNMEPQKLDVMDAIVSLAILNDPDLVDDLRIEHMDEGDDAALMENRRIVWQHPPPGTPLDPPYLVLVAVEHQDLVEAQEEIDDIFEQLTTKDGFKVPRPSKPTRRRRVPPYSPPINPIKNIR